VLVNQSQVPEDLLARYRQDGVSPLEVNQPEVERIEALGPRVVVGDLVERAEKRELWQKQDSLRHSPERVAQTLVALIEGRA